MPSQALISDSPERQMKQEHRLWWLDTCLALCIAAAIAFAANLAAQPAVITQTAGWMAQSAPSAAAQGVTGYLTAHSGAGPAEAAGVPGAALASAAQCLTAQVVAPASRAPDLAQP